MTKNSENSKNDAINAKNAAINAENFCFFRNSEIFIAIFEFRKNYCFVS